MRKLNQKSFYIIMAVQTFVKLKSLEARLEMFPFPVADWRSAGADYYKNMPPELLVEANLKNNIADFENVMDFNITKDMYLADMDELDQFYLF